MKCFEVAINNDEPIYVGAKDAPLVGGSIALLPGGAGSLLFSAHVLTGKSSSETRTWSLGGLRLGDELRVRIVEVDCPSPADRELPHGVDADSTSLQHACTLCRRTRPEVGKLLAAGHVSLCGECVDLCYQAMHGDNVAE